MLVERILLIISSMDLGGAQRVLAHMANYWAAKGKRITIITLDGPEKNPVFQLDRKVNLKPLNVSGFSGNIFAGLINNSHRIRVLRRAIRNENPQIIISFLDTTNIISLMAVGKRSFPIIVSEMSDPEQVPDSLPWRMLRKLTYPWASGIGVVTPKAKEYFSPALQKRIFVIPNPVVVEKDPPPYPDPIPSPIILFAGRLAKEKRIDLLMKAFNLLKNKYPRWHLCIVGDGPMRPNLESLRDELHLQERVKFFGLVKSSHYFLQRADLFVLCSQYEGFPMAMIEAMAYGLPVITTEYHYGVREIITDGVNGLIVPREDVHSLSQAMDRMMGSPEERQRLGYMAKIVSEKYSLENVMGMWENLIDLASSGCRK